MCHGHVASSSTVPPAALTCSVALTVSDGVDNEEGVTEGENDDYEVIRKAERMGQIMIVRSEMIVMSLVERHGTRGDWQHKR